jgi:hypothetical protein
MNSIIIIIIVVIDIITITIIIVSIIIITFFFFITFMTFFIMSICRATDMIINANATSYQNAVNLKSALEQSDIFTDVHFNSIGDGGSGEQSGKYPYTVVLSATLKQKDAK